MGYKLLILTQLLYEEQRSDSPYRKKVVGSLLVVLLLKIKARFRNDYNPLYEGNRGSQIVKTFRKDPEQHFRDLVSGKAMSMWIAEKTVAEAKSMLQDAAVPIKEVAYRKQQG